MEHHSGLRVNSCQEKNLRLVVYFNSIIMLLLLFLLAFSVGQLNLITATGVYGQQESFTTNTANNGGVSATSISEPQGIFADSSNSLYLADKSNSRVLRFALGSTTANFVWGQSASFSTNTVNKGGISSTSLNNPFDICVNSSTGRVYISDRFNHRVLSYPSGSAIADMVWGQGGSFTSNNGNSGGPTSDTLNDPAGIFLDRNGDLYVADSGNNRVLVYAPGSTTPYRVYGQLGSFTTSTFRPPTADSLFQPSDIMTDLLGDVYIVDANRIVKYTGTSTTASFVFGQPNLVSRTQNRGGSVEANTLSGPSLIYPTNSGGTQFWVGDTNNNRVLSSSFNIYTEFGDVYGQGFSIFTTNDENKGGLSASSLSRPAGGLIAPNGGRYISDTFNNRVLYYPPASSFLTTTPSTNSPGSSNVCFHASTTITYNGKNYTLFQLQNGEESDCHIPHLVRAKSVHLDIVCDSTKQFIALTADHLIFTDGGLKAAGKFVKGDMVYVVGGTLPSKRINQICHVDKVTFDSFDSDHFGLNCLKSTVHANGILVSTFGQYHSLPSAWMSIVGHVFGVKKASTFGDSISTWWFSLSA